MTKKSDFQRVRSCFLAKHNALFGRSDNCSPAARGLFCETLIEGIASAGFYDFRQVPRKRLFRVFYLLTKCLRYNELQMYRLMSQYADDDSIIAALESDDWKFFVNLFDIVSMGWRHDDDVCAFLYRDWHDGSTVDLPKGGCRMW